MITTGIIGVVCFIAGYVIGAHKQKALLMTLMTDIATLKDHLKLDKNP